MAYSKKSTKSKTSRKSYSKKKISYAQLPAGIRPEMKKIVRTIEGTAMSALTENLVTMKPYAHIATGSQQDERVGNEINTKAIHIKGHLENRSSVANTMLVRIALVRDKKFASSTFVGDDCLIKANAPVSLGSLGAESSYLSWNKERYAVLMDKTLKMGSSSINGTDIKLFNYFIKLRGKAKYDYQEGVTGAINTGNYQLVMWCCDPDNSGQSTSSVNGYCQITAFYTDP